MVNRKNCLVKGCSRPPASRGLCGAHYAAANYAVNTDKTTWDELIELGLALPSATPGRKGALRVQIEKRRQELASASQTE
jgi:hypothetical protein